MAAKCAREECGKSVYPMEELKCLDQIWHKGCFKCSACGMTLSMKTYKGYEKKPYCNAHYPKTVPSAVIDTPDMLRAKQNTALQSSVKYHEEYEKKMKGTKMEVADDPEMKRLLANTQNQSMVSYHGEQKKKVDQDQHREQKGQPQNTAAGGEAGDKPVGSIADYDPMKAEEQAATQPKAQAQAGAPAAGGGKAQAGTGFTVKALYDYSAADKDEVSFKEGDVIVNCQKVDDGWMTGTVQRTLLWGMLPANYVEKVSQPTGMFRVK